MAGEGEGGKPAIAPIDAWFLDGFSPARNPELWDADLLKVAADLTAHGGTLATYTAAGWVRRNLQAAGFEIEKAEGFAGKREMVKGESLEVGDCLLLLRNGLQHPQAELLHGAGLLP